MLWKTAIAVVVVAGTALWGADDQVRSVRFGKEELGKVPKGWQSAKTGKGEGSEWKVVEDGTAPSRSGYVLAQTAESPSNLFNVCVMDEGKYKDVDLSVSFKAMAGKKDQGGGFVWRYQDNNNYYICRLNPLEDNYRVYKVVDGKRSAEFQDETVKVPLNEWHRLGVKMAGDHIECFLDGKKILDVKDPSITEAGKVGLWTKADAQTRFDEFKVSGK
jgi:Domain of Unknown Function (DUF1080)